MRQTGNRRKTSENTKKYVKSGAGLLKKGAALVMCACAGAAGGIMYVKNAGSGDVVINTVSSGSSVAAASESSSDSAAIAKKISASVVAITTENIQTSSSWFGSQVSSGAGSGVVLSKDGYIVTCAHVISGATKIGVTTSDNKKYIAQVVGSDSATDTALLKISASNLTPATLADSDKIQQGQKVYAVGNPEGTYANSVTSGIISAKSRTISVSSDDDSSSDPFGGAFESTEQNATEMKVIQTDASVSPGNSGGGLFDEAGNLIGIVNAKSSGSNTEGIGFAIPEKTVTAEVKKLIKNKGKTKENESVAGQDQVQMA